MIYLLLFIGLWFAPEALAHTGALDAYGCHSNTVLLGSSAKRECHAGPLTGQVFSSTTAEYQAYIVAQTSTVLNLQAKLAACEQKQCPAIHPPGDVNMSWTANTEPDLAGYIAYCGTATHVYDLKKQVGLATLWSFTNLPGGKTYYCAVTAYDNSGNESKLSQEVNKVLP